MVFIIILSIISYALLEKIQVCSKSKPDGFESQVNLTKWCLLFAVLWFCNFAIGCQHMIVAGAVSTWYFKRYVLYNCSNVFLSFEKVMELGQN